tara:strand:+ start:512 stop:706 length:195 start_codon:yes stop_codon:yes gene_type:complete
MSESILWGIKKGNPDWMQEIITNDKSNFEKAKAWARRNGFDRFRVAEIDTSKAPDFTNTLQTRI